MTPLVHSGITRARLGIRGYIGIARKHVHDVLTVLRGVMAGDPWRPPVPAAMAA